MNLLYQCVRIVLLIVGRVIVSLVSLVCRVVIAIIAIVAAAVASLEGESK